MQRHRLLDRGHQVPLLQGEGLRETRNHREEMKEPTDPIDQAINAGCLSVAIFLVAFALGTAALIALGIIKLAIHILQ